MNKRIRNKHIKAIIKVFTWRLITANPKKSAIVNAFKHWNKHTSKKAPTAKQIHNVWSNYKIIRDGLLSKPKLMNRVTYIWLIFMGMIASNANLSITSQTFRSLYQAGVHNL